MELWEALKRQDGIGHGDERNRNELVRNLGATKADVFGCRKLISLKAAFGGRA